MIEVSKKLLELILLVVNWNDMEFYTYIYEKYSEEEADDIIGQFKQLNLKVFKDADKQED